MSIPWRYTSSRDGELATYRACGIDAFVMDCDGDFSHWEVRRGKNVIGVGSDIGGDPYHFDACLAAAEACFLDHVRNLKAIIRSRKRLP